LAALTSAAPEPQGSEPTPPPPAYEIADPALLYRDNCRTTVGPFQPTPDAAGRPASWVRYGIENGAAYHIEVPLAWNGEVVVWAHGYSGEGSLLCAGMPSLREHYIERGYAWAASSYRANGYDVETGVRDSRSLLASFARDVATPSRVYLTGDSMGGHIAVVAIERYRGVFDGAMPVCGVLGDVELFDYFLDVNVTAAAMAGAAQPAFPVSPADYAGFVRRDVLPRLGPVASTGELTPSSLAGRGWAASVAQRSGGTRPGFASAFGFWNGVVDPAIKIPFLFSVYPGTTSGTIGSAGGNVTDNAHTVYQLDSDPALTAGERRLNDRVLRVSAAAADRAEIPATVGDPRIPVMSLHTLGDLLVPFSMEQAYAQRVAVHGDLDLLTQRAIRGTLHCDFTPEELATAFDDLVMQVETGVKPAEDDVLDAAAVADPQYGCRFTRGAHPHFTAETPCTADPPTPR